MPRKSKLLSLFLSLVFALLVLTASIAVPILCRAFYYAHIGPLRLEQQTGLSRAEIKQAYDEMVDFCIGRRTDFSTGVLPWSESGRAHFVDVRGLFLLDLGVLAACAAILAVCLLLRRRVRPYRFRGRGPGFWGAAGLAAVFAVVGALAAVDFDRAFVVFHALFFPGKTNWLFDPATDAIITILPEVFFRNCGILIVALLFLWCAILIVFDRKRIEK